MCDDNKAFILNVHAWRGILHIITFRNMSRKTNLNECEGKSDLAFQFLGELFYEDSIRLGKFYPGI